MRIVTKDVSLPTAMTVDHRMRRLYWADANLQKVESVDYDGKDRRLLLSHFRPKSLHIYGEFLYFSDPLSNGIYRVEKYTGGDLTKIRSDVRQPGSIAIYEVGVGFYG